MFMEDLLAKFHSLNLTVYRNMDAKSIHSYDILWPISAFLHTLGEGRGEAMLALLPYDRAAAVRYAHIWAYGRNRAIMITKASAATARILRPNASMQVRV